jgi:hypothetical protein
MIVFIIEAKHTEKITQVLNTHLNELSQEQIVHTKNVCQDKEFLRKPPYLSYTHYIYLLPNCT